MSILGIELTDGTDILSPLPLYDSSAHDDSATYSTFASLPDTPGFYHIEALAAGDNDAPVTSVGNHWWVVIQSGPAGSAARQLQIAQDVFSHTPYIYFRSKHDTTWSAWRRLTTIDDSINTVSGTVTTPSIAANAGASINISSVYPSSYRTILAVFLDGYWPKSHWNSYLVWNAPNVSGKTMYVQNVGTGANSFDLHIRVIYTK